MKLKTMGRKMINYIRYDLKEIAFPSSLPDPYPVKKPPKLTWEDRYWILKKACRLYSASWVRDIGPDLRPHLYTKENSEDNSDTRTSTPREPSLFEDLAVAAKGGMETLKPALQRAYMMRASAYRDALRSFIEGYQEGIHQVLKDKEDPDADLKVKKDKEKAT